MFRFIKIVAINSVSRRIEQNVIEEVIIEQNVATLQLSSVPSGPRISRVDLFYASE